MGDELHETHDEIRDDEEALSPANIIDRVQFGRRLRAARIMHGFDRMSDFAALLRSRYGVDVSDRTVYAIERGEQMAHMDFFLAACHLLQCPFEYFAPTFRHDVSEGLAELQTKARP